MRFETRERLARFAYSYALANEGVVGTLEEGEARWPGAHGSVKQGYRKYIEESAALPTEGPHDPA